MASTQLEQIQELLKQHHLNAAIHVALEFFGTGDPEELAHELGQALIGISRGGTQDMINPFLTGIESFLDKAIIDNIRDIIEGRTSAADSRWADKLPEVTQERLGRELREAIRLGEHEHAFENARNILAFRVGSQSFGQRCDILGALMGSLENQQDECDKVWKRLKENWIAWKIPTDLQKRVVNARKKRYEASFSMQAGRGDQEYRRYLNELAISLKNELPSQTKMGKATEEDVDKFCSDLTSLVEGGLRSPKQISLKDVMWVLVEFTPRKQTSTAKLIGVEQRIHATLSPQQTQVVTRAFKRLSTHGDFCGAILKIAQDPPSPRYQEMALDLMSSIQWNGFVDFAHRVIADRKRVDHHPSALRVLGACGGEDALHLLMEAVERAVKQSKGEIVQGSDRRMVLAAINAISGVLRRENIVDQRRSGIIVRLSKVIPKNDTDLNMAIANLCLYKPEDLPPKIADWATHFFILGLWRPDKSAVPMAQMDIEEIRQRPLGHRQQYVQVLIHLGDKGLPALHRFLASERARVTGAYIAAAEVMGKLKNPDSVEALEHMLRHVRLTDDEELRRSTHEDPFFDVEAGRLMPLTKDHLIGAIADALKEIGTPEALKILHGLRDAMKTNHLPGTGARVAGVLTDLDPLDDMLGVSDPLDDDQLRTEAMGMGASPAPARAAHVDVEELVADLRSKKIMGFGGEKIRVKKIAALQALGEALPPTAIEPIIECLGDKDSMIRASARTTLQTYSSSNAPMALREMVANFVIDELQDPNSKSREGLIKFLADTNIKADPWAKTIEVATEMDTEGALKVAMAEIDSMKSPLEASEPRDTSFVDTIRLKQEYLAARRAWVAAGKPGDPPVPPEGLDLG